jgi:predicted ATP-grasp superfamily ATP-dependent carboligase
MPQNRFFAWKDPEGRRDLLIFVGEAQPSAARYDFCHRLLDQATEYGISGIVTFAAMATQLHPTHEPRVFGVATRSSALKKLGDDVEVLEEGQISGLNGVFLAAAAERGFEGFCLLGELPFFAVGVPNPRASQAVLEVFTKVTGTDLDFAPLQEQAEQSEQQLMELLERLNEETGGGAEAGAPGEEEEPETEEDRPELEAQQKNRIEHLFRQAQEDRSKAMELKQELDRLGVFKQYEDRFLDLFKQGG